MGSSAEGGLPINLSTLEHGKGHMVGIENMYSYLTFTYTCSDYYAIAVRDFLLARP